MTEIYLTIALLTFLKLRNEGSLVEILMASVMWPLYVVILICWWVVSLVPEKFRS